MKKKERRQKITFSVIVILVVAIALVISISNSQADVNMRSAILEEVWDFSGENPTSYNSYLSRLNAEGNIHEANTEDIIIQAADYKKATPSSAVAGTNNGIYTYESGKVDYEVNVPESGTYYIEVGYFPTADSNNAIVRNLYINGDLPFDGAEGLTFDRMWTDSSKDFLMDSSKNQGFPSQEQAPAWTSARLESSDRSVTGPYMFYLEKGKNTITLEAVQATLELSYIKLIPTDGVQTYANYLAEHSSAKKVDGSTLGEDGWIMVQGEGPAYKSSAVMLPQNDRTSAVTVPYHASNIVLNTIGGTTWDAAGMNLTWEVTVPEAGLYQLAARFMQAENRDFYSVREVKINGVLPFEEASLIKFNYDSKFQVDYLGNENGAFYFYLDEGVNTITMTVTLGDLTYAVEQTGISVQVFNSLYRELVSVMGSSPDAYRDYKITSSIPDMVDIMKKEYIRLTNVMHSVGDTLEDSTKTRSISKLLLQLEKLIAKPDSISTELSNFNSNITAISEWMLSLNEQPLQLDYILICGEGSKLPKAEGNIFENMAHSFNAFIGSFTNDYKIVADGATQKEKTIEVWIATSTRDQYDVAQRMVNNAFIDKPYSVELKMVGADTVMPSTLTGNGPDVAIQLNYTMPTNFAFRNAAYDLRQFADYEEVASRFADGALEYFEYEGGAYAFPDQMSFPVMFYRTDILAELGLEVPQTWDELIALLPYLQAENMGMYFVTTVHTTLGGASSSSTKPINSVFMSRLYQNGVELYRDNGAESNLDDLGAMLTFKEWTEYYTKQSFDLSASVVQRFRTGQMPIIIEDYTYVNSITAAAPEIEGAWSIAPIPGTIREDGTFDRSVVCMVGASMILKTTVETNDTANEAWDFLKWWTSEEVQVQYAEEQMSLLGDSADVPLANLAAIKTRAEERGTIDTIEEILKWVDGVPQVPGGYITGREVENAFLEVVNNNLDPVDTLYAKLRYINAELDSKREEFGLTE